MILKLRWYVLQLRLQDDSYDNPIDGNGLTENYTAYNSFKKVKKRRIIN